MKKLLLTLTMVAVMANVAFAERGDGNRHHGNKSWGQMDKRGGHGHPRGPMDEETMSLMRAHYTIIRDLGKQAREETDEVKKAELITELRVKLNEVTDLMVKKQEARLAHAEERLTGLKEKIEAAKTDREKMIDEKLERILSGERPDRRPDAFNEHPYAKGGRHGHRGGGYPFGDMPPPPPMEDDATHPLEDDAPPPPPAD